MPDSKPANQIAVSRAKFNALKRTARLFGFMLGFPAMIIAAIVAVACSAIFHLNPLVAFCGSFVGFVIVCLFILPIKTIYRSSLTTTYQEEKLWDLADQMAFGPIEGFIQQILDGKDPDAEIPSMDLALSQATLRFIRKGEMRKALKIKEYAASRQRAEANNFSMGTLGNAYATIGEFKKGLQYLERAEREIVSEGRTNSPAYTTTLLGKAHVYLMTHRLHEAEECLNLLEQKLKEDSSEGNTQTDDYVRSNSGNRDNHKAFILLQTGQLLKAKGDPDGAYKALSESAEIMNDEALRKRNTLMYPEIQLFLSEMEFDRKNYKAGEQNAKQSVEYYRSQTQYRGPCLQLAEAHLAYAQMKQSEQPKSDQFQKALDEARKELEENHPYNLTMHCYLAESKLLEKNSAAAKENYEAALAIAKALYPSDDPEIAELQKEIDHCVATPDRI